MARNKSYRFVLYLFARVAAFLLFLLPRRMLLFLAKGMGRVAYFVVFRHRDRALENLRAAYGSEKNEVEIQSLACRVFEHLAQTGAEVLQFPKLNREKIRRFVDGEEGLLIHRRLLEEGRGVINLTCHIGNWELLAGLLKLNGIPGKAIARRLRYEPYNRWIKGLRRAVGLSTVYRDDSPREILKVLQAGHVLGILPDQDIDSLKGVFVTFFGRPAYTSVAPVKLALTTGAPILTNFVVRLPSDRYRWIAGDIIRPQIKTTREDAILEYTQAWMSSCEKIIRQYPDQWAWIHNRWKTKPPLNGAGAESSSRTGRLA